ncbi:MAG: hypothetical protein J7M19_06855 [Planctomycetes bacterium]|nr:hypothetical protein [Planctomycetota bacterium]
MSESEPTGVQSSLDLSALPGAAAKAAGPFFEQVVEDAGQRLLSIGVVGSAATGDFRPGLSDVNSVVVLTTVGLSLLDALASLGRKFGKRGVQAPLLMTPEYIERSLDVFPLEFHEFKLAHVIIYGRDFFDALTLDREHVRLACERDLKGLLVKARRGYLGCLNRPACLKGLLVDMTKAALPVLRGLLLVRGEDVPVTRSETLAAIEALEISQDPFREILEIWETGETPPLPELQETFKDFYDAIETLGYQADRA